MSNRFDGTTKQPHLNEKFIEWTSKLNQLEAVDKFFVIHSTAFGSLELLPIESHNLFVKEWIL